MTIVPAVSGLVLYDSPRSSSALRVGVLPAGLGLPHERRTIALPRPRPDGYLGSTRSAASRPFATATSSSRRSPRPDPVG